MSESAKTISPPAWDEAIIEGLFRRDGAALEAAQQRYSPLLKRIISRFLKDERDREEALSDTLLRLWQAIPPHRPASLPAFLTTLSRRAAIDKQRSVSRAGAIPPDCVESLEELAELLPDRMDTEEQVLAGELAGSINRYLEELSPRRREIFLRRYYGAEPIRSMAAAMGLSLSTVEKELKLVRDDLKEKLEKEGYIS